MPRNEGKRRGRESTASALKPSTQAAMDISSTGSRTQPTLPEAVGGGTLRGERKLIFAWRRAHRSLALVGGCPEGSRMPDLCCRTRRSSPDWVLSRGRTSSLVGRLSLSLKKGLPGRLRGSLWARDGLKPRLGGAQGLTVKGQTRRVAAVVGDRGFECPDLARSFSVPQGRNFFWRPPISAGYPAETDRMPIRYPKLDAAAGRVRR